jgi:hypothetical protein
MYYTGTGRFVNRPVPVARSLRDRKLQRALVQFFKPENYFEVREALVRAGRADLIGTGCDALIPANPPQEALEARRRRASAALDNDHDLTVPNPARARPGDRPQRPTQRRQRKPGRG